MAVVGRWCEGGWGDVFFAPGVKNRMCVADASVVYVFSKIYYGRASFHTAWI